jgi:hypothetical protein
MWAVSVDRSRSLCRHLIRPDRDRATPRCRARVLRRSAAPFRLRLSNRHPISGVSVAVRGDRRPRNTAHAEHRIVDAANIKRHGRRGCAGCELHHPLTKSVGDSGCGHCCQSADGRDRRAVTGRGAPGHIVEMRILQAITLRGARRPDRPHMALRAGSRHVAMDAICGSIGSS